MDNAITKNLIVAVAILSTGTHYKITTETYNQIHQAGLDDLIHLPYISKFANFKVAALMDIVPIDEYESSHPEKYKKSYNQPYTERIDNGYKIISETERAKLYLKGLQKVKPTATLKDIKDFMKPKKREVKYKTWQEAKAAGVV